MSSRHKKDLELRLFVWKNKYDKPREMVENCKESKTKKSQNEVGLLLHQHLVYLNVGYQINQITMSPEMMLHVLKVFGDLSSTQKHPRFHQKVSMCDTLYTFTYISSFFQR